MNKKPQISHRRFERPASRERIDQPTTLPKTGSGPGTRFHQVIALALLGLLGCLGARSVSDANAACTYSISPSSRVHGAGATTNTIAVSAGSGCAWTVLNTNDWLIVLSGASGTGNGTVTYAVAANPSVNQRTGVVLIGGQPFSVTQRGILCSYSISPTDRTHGYGATSNSVSVTAPSSECAWTVGNTNAWINVLSGTNGSGDGTVLYAVAANPGMSDRTGVVLIGGQSFTVTQRGIPCSYAISPIDRTHGYGATTNSVSVTTTSTCAWNVANTNAWISLLSDTSGTGDGIVLYAVAANSSASDRTGVVLIGGQPFTVTQRGIPCAYSISPTDRTHGYGATTNLVSVTAANGCAWATVNTNPWISVLSGSSGTGDGTVLYAVAANPSISDRAGVLLIGGQSFSVTQRGQICSYSISPTDRMHGYGATTNFVTVSAADGCGWSVMNTNNWITLVSDPDGIGGGTVAYQVDANPNPMDRTGLVVIADQVFTLKQRAVVCTYDISPTNRVHGFGAATGTVIVSTSSGCDWLVTNTNAWVTILSSTTGQGFGSVGYSVAFNHSTNARSGAIRIADQILTLTQRGLANTGFFFESIVPDGSHVKLHLLAPAGAGCELQWSPDLIQWQTLTDVTNATGSLEWLDAVPTDSKQRFYRAIIF